MRVRGGEDWHVISGWVERGVVDLDVDLMLCI